MNAGTPALDRPWRRPGALTYARSRLRSIVRPPVTVSAAPADLVKDSNVAVAMRDGVVLRVNVYRPAGAGPFPVIMSAHPYGKDHVPSQTKSGRGFSFQFRIMRQPAPVAFSSETGWEAPDPVWWGKNGYAVVNADLRGAGTSEGLNSIMTDEEATDVYDLIEWAGAQPWSNGNVGMMGVSYLAMSQYKAAALLPPSLKAIAPWEGFTDAYRDFFSPGGVVEHGFSRIWQSSLKRITRPAQDLGALRKAHPLRDEWWQSLVPDLEKIQVPMLVCTSFSDQSLHTVGSFRAFEKVASTDKFAYTHRGGKWATFYGGPAMQVQLGFFDRYLRGRDTPKPPPVRLEVRERGDLVAEVRNEQEWPLARTRWTDLYLGDAGVMGENPAAVEGSVTFATRVNAAAFTYAIDQDWELTGPMSLALSVSIDRGDDVSLFVGVEKWTGQKYVPFEGSFGFGRDRIATGWLRAALRELDPTASTPEQPVHPFDRSQPLRPGERVDLQIPLGPSSTLFRAGDSLRLLVAGRSLAPRNPLMSTFPAGWKRSARTRCTLHWGPQTSARLLVPVIPRSITG